MYLKILFAGIFFMFVSGQGITTEITEREKLEIEVNAIKSRIELTQLFISPIKQISNTVKRVNILKENNSNIILEPVMALRYSSGGFEIDPNNTPSDVLWITPGINFNLTIPVFYNFTSTWLYLWGRFHKHSAYGFNGNQINTSKPLFPFHPNHWAEYSVSTTDIWNGIEFDEGQGGIAILSPDFELIFGKFQTNLGPLYRDNLSISKSAPSFQQIRLHTILVEKFHFTYLFGSLSSGIVDSSLMSVYTDGSEITKNPQLPRYVSLHRLDILFKEYFRLGLYEQVIFGARSIPIEYLNPITPYWSVQHSLGDLDNLIMGIDWSWIGKKTRITGAFFMDEWNPYSTFNKKDNRNWFGAQIGFTYKPNTILKDMLIKTEYTMLDPRVYNHRFEINIPEHHGYPLGFWTGAHTEDIWIGWYWFINNNSYLKFIFESTKIGEIPPVTDQYENISIDFLDQNVKIRNVIGLEYEYGLSNGIILKFASKYFSSNNLGYQQDNFVEYSFSVLYNIPY